MQDNTMLFYKTFEQLVSKMTDVNKPIDKPGIEYLLIEIAKMLRLSKGITRLYRNPKEEAEGGGETLCCFDMHLKDKPVHKFRVVTSVMSIAEMTVYMTEDAEPLNDVEFSRLDLVMRTTLSYVSRNRLRDIVEELAFLDDSGYPNLRSLQAYLAKLDREGGFVGKAALHYNLRHFTLINQEVGRAAGDEIMRRHFDGISKLIGESGEVYRLGGDNFVALCPREKLDDVLTYLYKTEVSYTFDGGGTVNIRSNTGVFVIPDGFVFHDIGDIMEKIMVAYRAAQNGSSRAVFYDDVLNKRKEAANRVQELFPDAMRNEEFKVFYQPKVNIITGELCGAEALCRWFRNGKIVPPMDFIPVLEQNNDICRLDFYMLEHVCRDIKKWLDEGQKVVRISVNMSRRHMADANFLQNILDIIDSHHVAHEYLEIELTETTTDVEFKDIKRVVGGMRDAGIYTSIDDFGVGYSSINLIKGVPWNVLKIDRSFLPINDKAADNVSNIIFRHVVAMSKEIGLECVAEGVETLEHVNILKENGCDRAQGFLFDRPLPVEVFEDRLKMGSYYDKNKMADN